MSEVELAKGRRKEGDVDESAESKSEVVCYKRVKRRGQGRTASA